MLSPVLKIAVLAAAVSLSPATFAQGQEGTIEEMAVTTTREDVEFRQAVLSLINVVERHDRQIEAIDVSVTRLNQRVDDELGSLRDELKSLQNQIQTKLHSLEAPSQTTQPILDPQPAVTNPVFLTSFRVVTHSRSNPAVQQPTISFATATGQVSVPVATVGAICPHCRWVATVDGQRVFFQTCNKRFVALVR